MIDPELERRIRHRELEGSDAYARSDTLAYNDVNALLIELDRVRALLQSIKELAMKAK